MFAARQAAAQSGRCRFGSVIAVNSGLQVIFECVLAALALATSQSGWDSICSIYAWHCRYLPFHTCLVFMARCLGFGLFGRWHACRIELWRGGAQRVMVPIQTFMCTVALVIYHWQHDGMFVLWVLKFAGRQGFRRLFLLALCWQGRIADLLFGRL